MNNVWTYEHRSGILVQRKRWAGRIAPTRCNETNPPLWKRIDREVSETNTAFCQGLIEVIPSKTRSPYKVSSSTPSPSRIKTSGVDGSGKFGILFDIPKSIWLRNFRNFCAFPQIHSRVCPRKRKKIYRARFLGGNLLRRTPIESIEGDSRIKYRQDLCEE